MRTTAQDEKLIGKEATTEGKKESDMEERG
jgi:hypothetical protein